MAKAKKRQYLPLAILTVLMWVVLGAIVILVDPLILKDFPFTNSYLIFFIVWFLTWFFSISLILLSSKRGFLYSTMLTIVLMLRLIRLGHVANLVLLVGLTVAIDFYFSSR